MLKTKTYEFAKCHHKIAVDNQELRCLLREGHAGDCMSQYWWKPNAEQQSAQSDGCQCAYPRVVPGQFYTCINCGKAIPAAAKACR